jgi:hypothetical protein
LLSVGTTARQGSLPAVVDHGRTLVRADELREYIDRLQLVGDPTTHRPR